MILHPKTDFKMQVRIDTRLKNSLIRYQHSRGYKNLSQAIYNILLNHMIEQGFWDAIHE